MTIEAAAERDLPAVGNLLHRHGLPLDGLDGLWPTMVVARESSSTIVGVAAVEIYEGGALLRSVAVDPAHQGHGLARQLTEAALAMARRRGAATVFLLTTTAERFFPRFGFEVIQRDDVPAPVRASVEFQSACPASAVVMRASLAVTR